jgi:phage shock protein PspC (stress-responsive transcriptional regulator)
VCAAVGRATNTDPVLWRVLFAVLTLFGGVGLLAYLIGWLLIPADGDTASPIEAVLGRGRSRTSAPIAVIGAVAAILVFALVASEGLRPAVVGALVVLGAAILLSRGTLQRPNQQQPTEPEPSRHHPSNRSQ